jgi:5-methylcytosine-specific restriction endonuclease McrA
MPHATRQCPRCSSPYSSSQSACADCLNAAKRAKRAAQIASRPTTPCVVCGTYFRPSSTRNGTCSTGCQKVNAKRLRGTPELTEKPCVFCKLSFMPSRADSMHCSGVCAERARYLVRGKTPEYKKYKTEYHRAYQALNRVRLIENSRKWRESNRDHHRELSIEWYRANRERSWAASRAWAKANPRALALREHRRRARKRGTQVHPIKASSVLEKINYWGGACWMCSKQADTIDHVKPLAAGGYHMLANLRPACRSCNSSKGAKWFGPENLSMFIRL